MRGIVAPFLQGMVDGGKYLVKSTATKGYTPSNGNEVDLVPELGKNRYTCSVDALKPRRRGARLEKHSRQTFLTGCATISSRTQALVVEHRYCPIEGDSRYLPSGVHLLKITLSQKNNTVRRYSYVCEEGKKPTASRRGNEFHGTFDQGSIVALIGATIHLAKDDDWLTENALYTSAPVPSCV